MTKSKTAISLEASLLKQADMIAKNMNMTRSRFFVMALTSFIRKYEDKMMLRQINEAFDDMTEEEKTILARMKKKQRKMVENQW